MIIIVIGPAGSGKSAVAAALAEKLGWSQMDADDFHGSSNRAKMTSGIPLTDEDRRSWIEGLHSALIGQTNTVAAFSGLKRAYRDVLRFGLSDVRFVLPEVPEAIAFERVRARRLNDGHFMREELVESQYKTFGIPEGDEGVVRVDGTKTIAEIVEEIADRLKLRGKDVLPASG